MNLTHLHCRDFRCLESVVFHPVPGVNVIQGDNAQGKTSLLEAILYAATSKSHRTNTETELIRHGCEGFQVQLAAQRSDREVSLSAVWWKGQKRFKVNDIPQTRLSEILGRVHVVFFSPEDVELIKGGAAARRLFMDMELSQMDPGYLASLQRYRQALRQRNELLRAHEPDAALIAPWDAQLVQHGAILMARRADYVRELSAAAATAYTTIAQAEPLALRYAPDAGAPEALEGVMRNALASDLRRRVTSRGPHRDDIEVSIAGHPARSHASQGQQKSAALAIKLAETALVHARTGEYPVLMLDEVLAELDEHRARQLFQAVPSAVQCLVTTASPLVDTVAHGRAAAHWRMRGGRLEAQGR